LKDPRLEIDEETYKAISRNAEATSR